MKIKLFTITDVATEFKVGAIRLCPGGVKITEHMIQSVMLATCGLGFNGSYTCFMFNLNSGIGTYDPYRWSGLGYGRTHGIAHKYIEQHWNDLDTGDQINVEGIVGEGIALPVDKIKDKLRIIEDIGK